MLKKDRSEQLRSGHEADLTQADTHWAKIKNVFDEKKTQLGKIPSLKKHNN